MPGHLTLKPETHIQNPKLPPLLHLTNPMLLYRMSALGISRLNPSTALKKRPSTPPEPCAAPRAARRGRALAAGRPRKLLKGASDGLQAARRRGGDSVAAEHLWGLGLFAWGNFFRKSTASSNQARDEVPGRCLQAPLLPRVKQKQRRAVVVPAPPKAVLFFGGGGRGGFRVGSITKPLQFHRTYPSRTPTMDDARSSSSSTGSSSPGTKTLRQQQLATMPLRPATRTLGLKFLKHRLSSCVKFRVQGFGPLEAAAIKPPFRKLMAPCFKRHEKQELVQKANKKPTPLYISSKLRRA